jgi:alkanesulfonate monooxygenase SsuD/methylene tetrahydromethanopterin reductase-like flavin-dependent oxidoreductase (luciferase family)
VIEAADGYRAAFRPSADLDRPYVSVSADVVVAEDRGHRPRAGHRLRPVGPQHPLRRGRDQVPDPRAGPGLRLGDPADRALVADRVDTQFVGSPAQVADQLEQLQDATGADELIITTITHDHADRVRSYQLLAEEWRRRP